MASTQRLASPLKAALLCLTLLATTLAFAADPSPSLSPALSQAKNAVLQGQADEATTLLRSILNTQPTNAAAHQLMCRVLYAEDLPDPAVQECELAVSNARANSENHLWLGRAYGSKATHSSPFAAVGLARKVREEFEASFQLDPKSSHAASDLGEFYINAPGFAGGGGDKAQALIARLEPQCPACAQRLRAMLAEKKNDDASAEADFKSVTTMVKTPASFIDLAAFYQRHDKPDQAVAAIQAALAGSPKDAVLVDAASILTSVHRSPELAERLLRDYLASPAKSDEAPAFKAHFQLGALLAKDGDHAGAQLQYTDALNLASSYAPARKALKRPWIAHAP
jgi:tetratricopeptide (TPR) repeat protein